MMGYLLYILFLIVLVLVAIGPAVLEVKRLISARVARKDSR